jgi:hypothetical protein
MGSGLNRGPGALFPPSLGESIHGGFAVKIKPRLMSGVRVTLFGELSDGPIGGDGGYHGRLANLLFTQNQRVDHISSVILRGRVPSTLVSELEDKAPEGCGWPRALMRRW